MATPHYDNYDTDRAIVARLHTGSEEAFTLLYRRFYQRVLYFARRYVPEAEAQDITSETFLQLWRKRADFDHLESLARFLFVTARNRCYDFVKHERVIQSNTPELSLLRQQEESEQYWQDQQVRIELVNLLQAQVNLLPAKTRDVFLLSFQEGLKPAQIAEQLGLSVQTVKNQKVTAIKLLKTALSQHPLELLLIVFLQLDGSFPAA